VIWNLFVILLIKLLPALFLRPSFTHSKMTIVTLCYKICLQLKQIVFNLSSTQLLTKTLKFHHITPVLKSLNGLKINERIKYKSFVQPIGCAKSVASAVTATLHITFSSHQGLFPAGTLWHGVLNLIFATGTPSHSFELTAAVWARTSHALHHKHSKQRVYFYFRGPSGLIN